MMVRFTERNNIKRTPTISKLMVKSKKLLPTLESHMLQHSFKLMRWEDHQSQVLHSFQILVSHTLRVLHITQEPHQWTQMPPSGKELPSTMEKCTVRNNTKRMLTTFKPMVRNKRLLLILESHMHQL
jgi:hypothetical protein